MSDEIVVDGCGTIAYADTELFAHAELHEQLVGVLREIRSALRGLQAGSVASEPIPALDDANWHLAGAEGLAAILAAALRASAFQAGIADRLWDVTTGVVNDAAGWLLGSAAWRSLPLLILAGFGIKELADRGVLDGVPKWFTEHNDVYTRREVGAAVQAIADGSDGFIAGFLGIPPWLVPALGGIRFSARTTSKVGQAFGLFKETAVSLEPARPIGTPEPPTTLKDAVARIKSIDGSGAQVLIEQYRLPDGGTVANVYVAGTIAWSPVSGDEPFDVPSDVNGVAMIDEAGYQTVRMAMVDAGLDAGQPVQLFGFSQGGIQAALVAASGEFNVKSLVTIGSPIGHIPIDDSIQGITVGHYEDPVLAVSDHQVNSQLCNFRTERFAEERPTPDDDKVPAHQFKPYLDTIARIDVEATGEHRAEIERIIGMTEGATVSSSFAYQGTRVQEP